MDGLLVVDKPAGWTSHDVVARCRRVVGQRRVGHAGTLDPDATGVLLVGVGRVTRLLRFLSSSQKSYEGEVVLGTATSTLDASGVPTGSWEMSSVTIEEMREAAEHFIGDIDQVPPMVSAVKLQGRRLHELARAGVEVERSPRRVAVYRLEVLPGPEDSPGVFRIEVDCSAGTYIRSLAADLGTALGGGAHLRNLRRTRVGSFGVDEAHPLEELSADHLISPAEAMRDMRRIEAGEEVVRLASHGLALDRVAIGATGEGPWALLDSSGGLVAIYEATASDRVVAAVVVAPA